MHSDKLYPISLDRLLTSTLNHLRNGHFFGISSVYFHRPKTSDPYFTNRYGQILETPIGVAAGPHTQLSQNIIAAWLTGSRFIELKTVQTLDELEVPKPCIDMQDEGYNCEWSQELKIEQSFDQYLDAWIMLHILRHELKLDANGQPGFIFNMSVGYNLEGIMKPNVQWFLNKMGDCSQELFGKINEIKSIYPPISSIEISSRISDNVTLSTMHGCPPDEIEKIASYLICDRKLHTAVKLNPTLLGKEKLSQIMADSGFDTIVPDQAFGHDLKWEDAVPMIKRLTNLAKKHQRHFGLKLTNTLESVNHKDVFPAQAAMMYNSGRSLHPISINLALKLQQEFHGQLDISFSGGAQAFNISKLVKCGLSPVTVCTDFLKPGGYGRAKQYLDELKKAFRESNSKNIDHFISVGNQNLSKSQNITAHLKEYATETLTSKLYKKVSIHDPSIKTARKLGSFDCIFAPCEETCPTGQDIPSYNYHAANANFEEAARVILQTNPFPRTTGMVCDHPCQTKCTRINIDESVKIREIKRFVAENGIKNNPFDKLSVNGKKVAIIGAGPSGLSAARFLAAAGFSVEVLEEKHQEGGMVKSVIPAFRLTNHAIETDIREIEKLGVKVFRNKTVDRGLFEKLRRDFDYVYIAAGAQNTSRLNIQGIDSVGVLDPLRVLEAAKLGIDITIGPKVGIIGGGNTAMDTARTAYRLAGKNGKVTVVYRRTIKQMPADLGEIKAVKEEGIEILELVAPVSIKTENGKVIALICNKMELGEKDSSGRRKPQVAPNSEFEIEFDTIIPAVGQDLAFDFGNGDLLKTKLGSYETQMPGVYIGGDALRGASTAINAIGDGRKVAQEIINKEKINLHTKPENQRTPASQNWHLEQRATRIEAAKLNEAPLDQRLNFNLIATTLSEQETIHEAKRCLLCDEYCSICVGVCPNLANQTYEVAVPMRLALQTATQNQNGEVIINQGNLFEVSQKYQIYNIADFCNECGNCNTFCPTAGTPFKDKPKIHLSDESWENAEEGFRITCNGHETTIARKANGIVNGKLSGNKQGNTYSYETEDAIATLNKENLKIESINFWKKGELTISLDDAAVMQMLLSNVSI